MRTAKEPIDLRDAVTARLKQLTFMKPIRLKDISQSACGVLTEGTSSDFTQGVRLNGSVAIFLDWWGWGMSNRYSFAVFEQADRSWSQVASRIEGIDDAVAIAIRTLAEHALRDVKAVP